MLHIAFRVKYFHQSNISHWNYLWKRVILQVMELSGEADRITLKKNRQNNECVLEFGIWLLWFRLSRNNVLCQNPIPKIRDAHYIKQVAQSMCVLRRKPLQNTLIAFILIKSLVHLCFVSNNALGSIANSIDWNFLPVLVKKIWFFCDFFLDGVFVFAVCFIHPWAQCRTQNHTII